MLVIGGYQKEGVITDEKTGRQNHYDSVEFACFADKWPDHIGLDDSAYNRFGTPVKLIKVPTAAVVSALNIPFSMGETSREILRKFDFENKVVGGEILPVYNEKGKVESVVFSLIDGQQAEISGAAASGVSVEDSTVSSKSDGKAKK